MSHCRVWFTDDDVTVGIRCIHCKKVFTAPWVAFSPEIQIAHDSAENHLKRCTKSSVDCVSEDIDA